jgi:predicted nuclease of restriction endonuclease-like (RecB) superfamily
MSDLQRFYADIKDILTTARMKAYSAVNFAMVEAYWLMGKRIVEEEQQGKERAEYGEYLIKNLSIELKNELGKGFSLANLKNFRQFYLIFPDFQKSYAVRSQLSWTHYRLIMRVENEISRNYYLTECSEQKWSTRILERNINSFYYERLLSSQEKKKELIAQKNFEKITSRDFIKDPYVLEFLGLPENPFPKENTIEASIVENLKDFLLEMGNGFSFVGRQFRISTETTHFYIDLVFYNYILKCFVLIDLKVGKLTHQDIGQMDMYVRMFDDLKKQADDNPTIGIILCSQKDDTTVKYSVLKENEQLFASKYRLVLPSEEELAAELARERRLIEEKRGIGDE